MSTPTNKFSSEVRARAMRMVLDHEGDHALPRRKAASSSISVSAEARGSRPSASICSMSGRSRNVKSNRRKIAALVGVASITKASGSSLDQASITGGRKALRDIMFMAALTASKHNPVFKAVCERLRANGKPHKLALVAVLRKLITMTKSRQEFKSALT